LHELGARKIRVSALNPGMVETEGTLVSSAPILKPAPSHKRRWVTHRTMLSAD